MTMHRFKNIVIAALVAAGTLTGMAAPVQASTLDSVLSVGEAKAKAARESQTKIDRLADETRDLLSDYKTVTKQIDGLKVYNARLQRQIDNQMLRIGEIDESIDQVTIISRQMTPLAGRKIDAYKGSIEIDGVERDVNFLRVGRISFLYQTTDTEMSGAWDQASRSWVPLSRGEYRNAIMKGLRIARKEASIDLMTLPVAAPEAN